MNPRLNSFLADTLTLFQSGGWGAHYAYNIGLVSSVLGDVPLSLMVSCRMGTKINLVSMQNKLLVVRQNWFLLRGGCGLKNQRAIIS